MCQPARTSGSRPRGGSCRCGHAKASWAIAFVEYCFQVPANRIGNTTLSLGQLKILQEVVTLTIFVPFAIFYMQQPLKLDYLWAGLCMFGAVYFSFRS